MARHPHNDHKRIPTSGVAFLWTVVAGLVCFGLMLIFPNPPPQLALGVLLTAAAFFAVPIGIVIAGSKSPVNIGHTKRFGDSRLFRLVRRLTGFGMTGCGCVYTISEKPLYRGGSYQGPEYETQESEPVWMRSEDGAKYEFKLFDRKYVRCENCGGYRTIILERTGRDGETVTVWQDDIEPYPDDNLEIVIE